MMYECLGCGRTNKLTSRVIEIPTVAKILCEECRSAMELGQHLAANKGVMRIITKFLDKELKRTEVEQKEAGFTRPLDGNAAPLLATIHQKDDEDIDA